MLEETEENKKMFKIVMLDSQESRVNRSQGLKREKEGTFKNLGLVAAKCNGIAACTYSFKNILTGQYMACSIKTTFYFFWTNGP